MISHSSVTVATTAASVTGSVADSGGPSYDEVTRRAHISNEGATDVFLGGPGVTTTAYGRKLAAGANLTLDLIGSDELFCVSVAGGEVLRVLHLAV